MNPKGLPSLSHVLNKNNKQMTNPKGLPSSLGVSEKNNKQTTNPEGSPLLLCVAEKNNKQTTNPIGLLLLLCAQNMKKEWMMNPEGSPSSSWWTNDTPGGSLSLSRVPKSKQQTPKGCCCCCVIFKKWPPQLAVACEGVGFSSSFACRCCKQHGVSVIDVDNEEQRSPPWLACKGVWLVLIYKMATPACSWMRGGGLVGRALSCHCRQ